MAQIFSYVTVPAVETVPAETSTDPSAVTFKFGGSGFPPEIGEASLSGA